MTTTHRPLTTSEIETMTAHGCTASDWSSVLVSEGFRASSIVRSHFKGDVKLGACGKPVVDMDGLTFESGITDATIINCTIGDNVLISGIGSYIANYTIGDNVIIQNTGRIVCRGSRFGNGVSVCAVNEGGGREVPIYEGLSAQAAYFMAMYRHRPELINALVAIFDREAQKRESAMGSIGDGARILSCGTLRDIRVGEGAVIEGATELENGTVGSRADQPTQVGSRVSARDFIFAPGAVVEDGTSATRCFVGEGCKLGHGFTTVDSLFFSNSHFECGEATSVFAGPYTVSHHKSSLLIAGYFLFFNAGSGANQSNHLFKCGPIHQGIHERGCKFGSNAYMMLPAREGAFTVVMGRHMQHHDTALLPYSYLVEENGKSMLVPAHNMRTCGTSRDIEKWPRRDLRGSKPADRIHFEELNPHIGAKLVKAIELCRAMLSGENVETHIYGRVRIKGSMLARGLQLYETALDGFLAELLSYGPSEASEPCKDWIDAAGMFMPRQKAEQLCSEIESGRITDAAQLERSLDAIEAYYRSDAYSWAMGVLRGRLGHEPTPDEIAQAIESGEKAWEKIERMRRDDAKSDFRPEMETGYGIDASTAGDIRCDFEKVRGIK